MRKLGGTLAALTVATALGCAQKPQEQTLSVEEKSYTVSPASVVLKAGVVTGEMSELKITERVEQGSGAVVSPPKLVGTLKLKNTSSDQAVRLVEGTLRYIDVAGKAIEPGEGQGRPAIDFSSSNSSERLAPGQELSQSVELDFPAVGLEKGKLKEIALQLAYLPTPYRAETATFPVSITAAP